MSDTKAIYREISRIELERRRKRGRARARMLNTVRTDYLEGKIAHLEALGDYAGAEALRGLASDVGAPINEQLIDLQKQARSAIYFEQ